jgi:hypothetical protein
VKHHFSTRALLSGAFFIAACAPAMRPPPPPTGGFVTRLGSDTIQVESYTRTPSALTGRALTRTPRTVVRDFTYRYNPDGTIARMEFISRPADLASDTIFARNVITFANDTAYVETGIGDARSVQWIPAPAPHVAWFSPLPFSMFEAAAQRAPATVGDSTVLVSYVGALGVWPFIVRRTAPDSVSMWMFHMGTIRAQLEPGGLAQGFDGIGSSFNFRVTRTDAADADSLGRELALRDAASGGLGPVSPTDTVQAVVHGASYRIEYGRPSVRGREIFGGVVPWGRVWRAGANRATHFTTDRDVVIGGVTLARGTYTLWIVPREDGRWELLVNRQTGQWGTLHDPAYDVGRIPMQVQRLSEPVEQLTVRVEQHAVGGLLLFAWDTYEASVPFSPR